MVNHSRDKDRRWQDQQAPQRINEQQQQQDHGAEGPSPGGQGGRTDTNRVRSDRHPTRVTYTDED